MPTSPDLTVLGLVIIGVGVVAFLFVVGAWIVAPFMLYAIDSRLRETNELLRFLATRPPAMEHPAQDAGTPPPTFQLLR
jgi:hypothetical protein